MSHYVVKLASGELVYGTIDESETDKKMIVLHNPLIWEDYETDDGRVGSALVNYMVGTTEAKVPIAIAGITSMAAMSQTFANFYDVAVAVQKITDEAYKEKLVHMTKKMLGMVIEYQARQHADKTGDIVMHPTDSDTTIH
jgi:hypothetical protein